MIAAPGDAVDANGVKTGAADRKSVAAAGGRKTDGSSGEADETVPDGVSFEPHAEDVDNFFSRLLICVLISTIMCKTWLREAFPSLL